MKFMLIAHRGVPLQYPENSLAGFEAALEAGAVYVEADVQLTADGIPILSHDPSTLKLTGQDLEIAETDYARIEGLPAGYPERFGDTFSQYRIARLAEFVALLSNWPETHVFIELKKASIEHFGQDRILETVLDALSCISGQCSIISFDHTLLQRCRELSNMPIGWVLPEWSDITHSMAGDLRPEYLFCNRKRLPLDRMPFWEGSWRWVIYTLNDAADVTDFLRRGAHMFETDTITTLL